MAAAARLAAVALACAAVASGAPSCTGPATPIHRVQGVRHASPLVGETVTVEGRVTRVAGRFLYIQVRARAGLSIFCNRRSGAQPHSCQNERLMAKHALTRNAARSHV